MSNINYGTAIEQIIQKYKADNNLSDDYQLDEEDTPLVGVFKNGFIIINFVNGEVKIDVRGGDILQFNDSIDIFESEK